ncbi:helix-turn-helix transcriptional regulator [Marinilabilia salmonicolor]|uniref:helix-turn-helix transcriptional regulator n=1 Tax=Marinilabilia salmonicolor TaxID=989 RepID=UPI00031837EB|nr:hypothetical protein [Marinilabilia salmonicolor]
MKDLETNKKHLKNSMVFLPAEEYESLLELTKNIHNILCGDQSSKTEVLDEYISEKDAKKEFDRKTTWFWNQRQNGKLPYTKVGSRVYYKKSDLHNLLKVNRYDG